MDNTAATLLLKVLTGRHRGARLPLLPGRYLVGSSDECDIILSDPEVAPKHLLMEVGEEQVRLVPQEGGIVGPEGEISEEGDECGLYQPFLVGGVYLAVGRGEEPWPQLEIGPAAVETSSPKKRTEEEKTKEGEEPDEAQETQEDGVTTTGSSTSLHKVVAAASVMLIILSTLLALWLHGQKDHQGPDLGILKERISAKLKREGLSAVKVESGPTGTILVSGFVPDSETLEKVAKELERIAPGILVELVAMDYIKREVKDLLGLYGFKNLEVHIKGSGKISIWGLAGSPRDYQRAIRTIKEDLPLIKEIEDMTIGPDEIRSYVQKSLEKKGVSAVVVPLVYRDYLVLKGPWNDPALEKVWPDIKREISSAYRVIVRKQIGFASDQGPKSPIKTCNSNPLGGGKVVGAVTGKRGYVVLDQGDKFFLGSMAPGGCVLKEISSNRLIFDCGNCNAIKMLP